MLEPELWPYVDSLEDLLWSRGRAEKVALRRQLLKENPSARRSLDLFRLRKIVDFKEIVLAPDCSIARGEAIEGSDLDGGLVITESKVSIKTRMRFIEELRRQGFTAYDVSEREAADSRYRRFKFTGQNYAELERVSHEKAETECAVVKFFTRKEIEKAVAKGTDEGWLYRAGKVIK